MQHEKKSFYALKIEELTDFLNQYGHSAEVARIVFAYIYKKSTKEEISKKVWELLETHFDMSLPTIGKVQESPDGTVKFEIVFHDQLSVETVLIPFHKRFTVCLSSQVGCLMKCSFCYTGTMGLKRHLKAHEIIMQYVVAKNYLEDKTQTKAVSPNIVFMGQGEPLHNVDAVKDSIELFRQSLGLGIGPRQMTLSTSGYLPGIKKLGEFPEINLALSLHSPFNEIRKELIPINQHYPIEEVLNAFDQIDLLKRQFVTYEYLLIDELNDRKADADELLKLLGHRKAIINIIPFNPFPGSQYRRPSSEKVDQFKEMLVERKLRAMIRTTKGSDILAACGQLNTK